MTEAVITKTNFQGRRHQTALFALVFVIWTVFDSLTKRAFDVESNALGQLISGPYAGIFQFRLVHNTGGAWGIFSDSTIALGVFSVVVSLGIIVLFFVMKDQLNLLETFGMALLASGGIGNAIDRFVNGYVVDFIDFAFMNFPVFNIADIGVTCGIALLVIGYVLSSKNENDQND